MVNAKMRRPSAISRRSAAAHRVDFLTRAANDKH
jgi:hypothetical protein